MNDKTGRGLAVIYDPHNLYQFLWYYCNEGKKKEWDALCLPNGYKGEYMHSYCEKSGIFDHIYRDDTDYSVLTSNAKFKTFLQMFFYWIVGKRKVFCKKMLNKYVTESLYDEFVVIAEVGVVSGACVALGYERKVVILEDGITDYRERPIFIRPDRMTSAYMWQGFFLSIMGYCSPGWFRLASDKYCIKYCSHPSKMKYTNYREIKQLYEMTGTDHILLEQLLKRVYPALCEFDFDIIDIILMTSALGSIVDDCSKYNKRVEEYIKRKGYANVLLKKHPRDDSIYCFGDSVAVKEADSSIPVEVLFPYCRGKEAVIMALSSSIIGMSSYDINCTVLYLEGLYEDSSSSAGLGRSYTYEEIQEYCDSFLGGQYRIVRI